MDVEQLHVVLQQSFSADAALRKPAEETIRNLKNLPAAVQLLLQVAAEKQVSKQMKLFRSKRKQEFLCTFVATLARHSFFSHAPL
jgi:hypothetical protein